jgi:hypothetical protein
VNGETETRRASRAVTSTVSAMMMGMGERIDNGYSTYCEGIETNTVACQ